ncbi:protein indeterminate-domain 5, chloroplastic-like [Hibiscus syriacus]|uniref:protein indeterminate-domain 5, chloroplastic-like n=1 Tax=Hibiscus syriacus TaxID=106335 RepID=UPI00192159AB|nr:protein indeterminate-domain 5, chloroplastic-like [Hibiscus syriacus]
MAAAPSSSGHFFGIGEENQNQMKILHSSTGPPVDPPPLPQKKKRNQPGTPSKYPDAEVVALSPKTLMATNRFICEVCNKGFQREQNLQLHRRGHNLPWKLKQKTTKEVKKKVYLCPEPTCVHHDPSRPLGDLTGIKKHYSRKHGEKKWKCDKCSKRYAVQSDWKAHSKTCGTREYRCDCGTLFSRRDSFITHRAFCDALAQETARQPPPFNSIGTHLYESSSNYMSLGLSQVGTQISSILDHNNNQTAEILKLGGSRSSQLDHLLQPSMGSSSFSFRPQEQQQSMVTSPGFVMQESNQIFNQEHHGLLLGSNKSFQGLMQLLENSCTTPSAAGLFNLSFHSNSGSTNGGGADYNLAYSGLLMSDNFNNDNGGNGGGGATNKGSNIFSNNLMSDQITSNIPSLFSSSVQNNNMVPQMSATALLPKADQMGSSSSNKNNNNNNNDDEDSLLRSFGTSSSTGTKSSNLGRIFGETTAGNNLHELMNSIASGNSPIFGISAGVNTFNTYANRSSMQHEKLQPHQQSLNVSGGGSDRLTRDFLGVGQIVRSMSGGAKQQQEEEGIGNTNITAPTSHQSFGGRGNFQ